MQREHVSVLRHEYEFFSGQKSPGPTRYGPECIIFCEMNCKLKDQLSSSPAIVYITRNFHYSQFPLLTVSIARSFHYSQFQIEMCSS